MAQEQAAVAVLKLSLGQGANGKEVPLGEIGGKPCSALWGTARPQGPAEGAGSP